MPRQVETNPGDEIRAKREALGVNRETVAFHAGLSLATIYRLENGLHRPAGSTLDAVRRALETIEEEQRSC